MLEPQAMVKRKNAFYYASLVSDSVYHSCWWISFHLLKASLDCSISSFDIHRQYPTYRTSSTFKKSSISPTVTTVVLPQLEMNAAMFEYIGVTHFWKITRRLCAWVCTAQTIQTKRYEYISNTKNVYRSQPLSNENPCTVTRHLGVTVHREDCT